MPTANTVAVSLGLPPTRGSVASTVQFSTATASKFRPSEFPRLFLCRYSIKPRGSKMTLQKDLNAALRCAAPSTNGRLVVVRNAESNCIESVLLDCCSPSPRFLNKLRNVAQKNSVSCWELCRSRVWGALSMHELIDADDDPTFPSQLTSAAPKE